MDTLIDKLDILTFAKDCKDYDIDLFNIEAHGLIKVYGNEDHPALFLKEVESFSFEISKTIAEIHKICWNYQKALFLYVYSKTEIRIYNCSETPLGYDEKNIKDKDLENQLEVLELYTCSETDGDKLEILISLFSRIAIDTGFLWTSERAFEIKSKIKLEKRVDKTLVQSLIKLASALKKRGLEDKDLIHRLIMRSLFLLYLEDRKATNEEFYHQFSENAKTYFKILENPKATFSLFKRLAKDFNGSLFNIEEDEENIVKEEHLNLIRQCFINGNVENHSEIFPNWRLFNFRIIRIELLSEIYENFLAQVDERNKKDSGTFYTPPSLVELILNEKLPIRNNEIDYNVKILDPSCGSGIFLVQSLKRLIKRYENNHDKKLTDFTILVEILKKNIFGVELDAKSIKVAAFSLYLTLLENLDPKTGWWDAKIQFPYLINDPDDKTLRKQGNNLFKRDTISDLTEIKELQNFDLVVGNPPFGTKNLLPTISYYCSNENFAQEMVLPFLHKATFFAPNGQIALIFNTKVLTNTRGTYQNFRKWLFKDNHVEKVYNFSILRKAKKYFGGQLFGSAVGPISIVFYQKEIPKEQKETITYYAPKTYIKNDVLEGIVIDSSDEKHLPRIECQKPDTKIWKIAMWGSYLDFELIEKIENNFISLEKYFKSHKNDWKKGCGLHKASANNIKNKKYITAPYKILEAKDIATYYSNETKLIESSKKCSVINFDIFEPPFLVIKEGQKNNKFCSSIVDFKACYYNTIFGIKNNNIEKLYVFSALFNSEFSNYYLSLITSSWGIERERVLPKEMLQLPTIFDFNQNLSNKVEEIISLKKSNEFNQNITDLEKQIDQIIYDDILKLTKDEQLIIQDTLHYSLDLFEKQEKSDAVKHVINIDYYTIRITKELNKWLGDADIKVSAMHYKIDKNCPLYMVKLSFGNQLKETKTSKEDIYNELKKLDRKLWAEEAQNLYFRKKLNYYDGDDIYIIKPNQRRFWCETAAMEDSKSLLVEILNMKE